MKTRGMSARDDQSIDRLCAALNKPRFSVSSRQIGFGNLQIRPMPKTLENDYVVFLGSDDTHGCQVDSPYPSLVQHFTGFQAINLGCVGARIDAFLNDDRVLEICKGAGLAFLEVMGAEAMSNRLYRVSARNNQRLVRVSKYLKALYEGVDFSGVETVSELLTALAQMPEEKLYFVKMELHLAWVARMKALINKIDTPVILLWISDHYPYYAETGGTIYRDPLFVDRMMIEALRNEVVDVVEIVANKSELYAELPASAGEIPTLPLGGLGPKFHERVAVELAPIVRAVMEAKYSGSDSNENGKRCQTQVPAVERPSVS